MASEIKDCLPPARDPRKPNTVLPKGSIDTHVHVFEPDYPLSPDRGYNPPPSTLDDLKHLHATLGIDRVVFTQPSIYGIDNSAILDGMETLNDETPNRARCVLAISMRITDEELAEFDAAWSARRTSQYGQQGRHADRARSDWRTRGAHQAFRLAHRMAVSRQGPLELMPVFTKIKVPMSIGHFAYQSATDGVQAPGFQALLELMRRGNTWMKISGANRSERERFAPV